MSNLIKFNNLDLSPENVAKMLICWRRTPNFVQIQAAQKHDFLDVCGERSTFAVRRPRTWAVGHTTPNLISFQIQNKETVKEICSSFWCKLIEFSSARNPINASHRRRRASRQTKKKERRVRKTEENPTKISIFKMLLMWRLIKR